MATQDVLVTPRLVFVTMAVVVAVDRPITSSTVLESRRGQRAILRL